MAAASDSDRELQAAPSLNWAKEITKKYVDEFERFFAHGADSFHLLHEQALLRQLQGYQLRSLAWRLFLQVLPADASAWAVLTREHRRVYELSKATFSDYTNINDTRIGCDVNNPLSLDQQSPWYRLFEHADLRRVIRQDVVRTMPEVALFRDEGVRRLMTDVLFVFMQKHPEVEYVQGMHELLAPIVYVLLREYSNFADVRAAHKEDNTTLDLLGVLLDKDYVEHDAFYLLEKVLLMLDWSGSANRRREPGGERLADWPPERPFAKDRYCPAQWEPTPCNRAVRQHLRLHDYSLYRKVVELGVEPQLFGLRMFRVLFGREFRLPELCAVWDALFADSHDTNSLDLVPYVFCAILIYHRNSILALDGMEVLTLLMNLPPMPDISSCVVFALHLRNPPLYRRPDCFPLGEPSPRKAPPVKVVLRRSFAEWNNPPAPREEVAAAGRPRSLVQPATHSPPPGRTLARRNRTAAPDKVANGPAPVDLQDVSALREKHSKMASFEATAYCVMESKQCETPAEWNPGYAGVPSRLELFLEEHARCIEKMEWLLADQEDLDVAALKEVLNVQKQLIAEQRSLSAHGGAAPPGRPQFERGSSGGSSGGGAAASPVEEVTPEAVLPAATGVSPAFDTLAVDVANLSLSELGER